MTLEDMIKEERQLLVSASNRIYRLGSHHSMEDMQEYDRHTSKLGALYELNALRSENLRDADIVSEYTMNIGYLRGVLECLDNVTSELRKHVTADWNDEIDAAIYAVKQEQLNYITKKLVDTVRDLSRGGFSNEQHT